VPGSIFPLELQPRIPEELSRLQELSNDLVYSWNRHILMLFNRLDRELWHQCGHNPKIFLRRVSQERFDEALEDSAYMEEYRRALSSYDAYVAHRGRPELAELFDHEEDLIAYFCLEFGFHESFPIYSGGLGVLAGDHCKAASDVGLPFVAIGLLYQMGYFTQTIDAQGQQQAEYTRFYPHDLPIVPTRDESGGQLTLEIDFPGRKVRLRVWTAQVGHIKLYLLDTNLPENTRQDRDITHQLYGGDRETRLQQEMVLGIGGVQVLRALGKRPSVWHINEGHAAFQILERCRIRMQQGLDFDSALELVSAGTVFTTHTPVPAGHDIFNRELIQAYLADMAKGLHMSVEELYALGVNGDHGFNMTTLALRGSRFHNGVSAIHGRIASEMEAAIWPQIPHRENPITHVTNGVHLHTFLAREWASLFDLHFDDWQTEIFNEEYWERLDAIPDYQYWSVHRALKQRLFESVRESIVRRQRRNGTSESTINRMVRHLHGDNNEMLVMGFARRFATYKRAALLFADADRLDRLLNDADRPAVIFFAGKAHPHDGPGQELIRQIHEYSVDPRFIGKILLLEGYDIGVARRLVSGVDVWLNTPEYPLEASGTSGQKAGMNGAVNLSVLDGWWDEGYNGNNGWSITPRQGGQGDELRTREESIELLNILEYELIPTYYRRDGSGYSPDWVQVSKNSMKSIIPRFNAQRMLMDYCNKLYCRARDQRSLLGKNEAQLARELAAWKRRVREAWPGVHVDLMLQPPARLYQDEPVLFRVRVDLNGLDASEVTLECLVGRDDPALEVGQVARFEPCGTDGGYSAFELELEPELAGLQHYRLRLYPSHPALSHPFELGCMIWL
jgi:starch phosphorylase